MQRGHHCGRRRTEPVFLCSWRARAPQIAFGCRVGKVGERWWARNATSTTVQCWSCCLTFRLGAAAVTTLVWLGGPGWRDASCAPLETTSLRFNSLTNALAPIPSNSSYSIHPPCLASSVSAVWQHLPLRCAPSRCFAPLLAQLPASPRKAVLLAVTLLSLRRRLRVCLQGLRGKWLHWLSRPCDRLTYVTDAQDSSHSNMQPSARRYEAMRMRRL
jgi:hypothetical protein